MDLDVSRKNLHCIFKHPVVGAVSHGDSVYCDSHAESNSGHCYQRSALVSPQVSPGYGYECIHDSSTI